MEEEEQEEQEKKRKKKRKMQDEKTERAKEEEAERVTETNFNDERKEGEHCELEDCEQNKGTLRRQTSYYCKTCLGEPSLCPVPCFELYHTRLIYKTAPELETQGEPSE